MQTITSKTAVAHGWGSDPYKWVSGLTPAERKHVRDGTATILVESCPPEHGNHGSTVRRVVYLPARRQYTHRVVQS